MEPPPMLYVPPMIPTTKVTAKSAMVLKEKEDKAVLF